MAASMRTRSDEEVTDASGAPPSRVFVMKSFTGEVWYLPLNSRSDKENQPFSNITSATTVVHLVNGISLYV